MNDEERLRMICEESGMDYSRLSEQDKQAVQEYLVTYLASAQPSEQSAYLRQKAYLAVLQNRLRRAAMNNTVLQQRPSGLAAGDFVVPDDFDATLPENILKAFEGR